MVGSFARALAVFVDRCALVTAVQEMVGKWRLHLLDAYPLDLYYGQATGRYSYALVREEQRVIAWDNAPHHRDLPNFPHHAHRPGGEISPSALNGDPEHDLELVRLEVEAYLGRSV